MGKVHLLDDSVISKIAAGEVVERPASIIKELVENAIDAESTAITVEIRNGGIDFIRISDNGTGIAKDDVPNIFLRHATSKIVRIDDLETLVTMGFRGEALYSIAAVAKVEVVTKNRQEELGTRYVIHGGVEQSNTLAGCSDGTTFTIEDLFYNTPVRRNFLKKPAAETAFITNLMSNLILSHPKIAFVYRNNGNVVFQSMGDGDMLNAIYSIYGKEVAANLRYAKADFGNCRVVGYVGNLSISRRSRSHQSSFVNGRYVQNSLIQRTVDSAYSVFTKESKYPVYILEIEVPPAMLDVNVHPNKLQVRFSDENSVINCINMAVVQAMEYNLKRTEPVTVRQPQTSSTASDLKEVSSGAQQENSKPINVSASSGPDTKSSQNPLHSLSRQAIDRMGKPAGQTKSQTGKQHDYFAQLEKTEKKDHEPPTLDYHTILALSAKPAITPVTEQPLTMHSPMSSNDVYKGVAETAVPKDSVLPIAPQQEQVTQQEEIGITEFSSHRVIGTAFNSYILLEYQEKLLFIDQHAAHERLLYEQYKTSLKNQQVISQPLLIPTIIELLPENLSLVLDHMKLFEDIGFILEEYGGRSLKISAVPFILGQPQIEEFFRECIGVILGSRSTLDATMEQIIQISCKKAVKAGDKLSEAEIVSLLRIITEEEIPLNCPHGRPFVLRMDKSELDKKFKRS